MVAEVRQFENGYFDTLLSHGYRLIRNLLYHALSCLSEDHIDRFEICYIMVDHALSILNDVVITMKVTFFSKFWKWNQINFF